MAKYTITHTLLEGNLLASESASEAEVEALAQSIADRVADAFPGFEVEIPIAWKTSGCSPRTRVYGPDPLQEDKIREKVDAIANQAWEEWCENLPERVRCACGQITGEQCETFAPPDELVTIEWMPDHLRASHEAAHNRGTYPHNGAERFKVTRECATNVTDDDWCFIVP